MVEEIKQVILFLQFQQENHSVTVTDANGCTGVVNFVIAQPTALNFVTVVTHVSCFGDCDAQIVVNAAGATPPYSYSSDNGLTFSPINTLSNLCEGNTNLCSSGRQWMLCQFNRKYY